MSELSHPMTGEVLDPAVCPTISVRFAAQVLGVSPATGYNYVDQGVIPVIRLSARRFRVPTERFCREVLGMTFEGGSAVTAPSGLPLDGAK